MSDCWYVTRARFAGIPGPEHGCGAEPDRGRRRGFHCESGQERLVFGKFIQLLKLYESFPPKERTHLCVCFSP